MNGLGMAAHARTRPDHPAAIAGDEVRTYGELADRGARLATALRERGVPDDGTGTVAMMLPNSVELFEVAAASCRAEARLLPVNWHLKTDELAYILGDSGAQVLVAHESLRDHVDAAAAQSGSAVVFVGDSGDYEDVVAKAEPRQDEGWTAPAFMFYTSGTTGRPKGVVHGGFTPQLMAASQQGLMALWGLRADDVHLLAGPGYHAGPLGYALTTLFAGGTVVALPAWDAAGALATIERRRVTTSFMTPAHFIRLLELPADVWAGADTSSFRLIIHGGAPCPPTVKRRIIEALPHTEVWELYGASEGGATRVSPAEWLERPGTVGLPWPGVEVLILDDEGNPLPARREGVIHIAPPGGPNTFRYHGDDAKTAAAWRGSAFTVGDVGWLDEDGYLYITDRVSDMVIRDGVNVYPREIEEVLYQHPSVVDCAVFGVPDERHGEVLVAVVEARGEIATDDLDAHVRAHLADFKCPTRWELIDTLPRDPNGKVLKRLLRAERTAS